MDDNSKWLAQQKIRMMVRRTQKVQAYLDKNPGPLAYALQEILNGLGDLGEVLNQLIDDGD